MLGQCLNRNQLGTFDLQEVEVAPRRISVLSKNTASFYPLYDFAKAEYPKKSLLGKEDIIISKYTSKYPIGSMRTDRQYGTFLLNGVSPKTILDK